MKKVLQYRTQCGWNRMSAENAIWFMRKVYPNWPDGRIRLASYYLLKYGHIAGTEVRFDSLKKCNERSYKGFTGTEEYFRFIESEGYFGT